MLDTISVEADARRKALAAMQRAVPVTRMVDYGVPLGDALDVHEAVAADQVHSWEAACELAADRHQEIAAAAEGLAQLDTAAAAWRAVFGLLQCAQLAYNHDSPRKRALFERAHDALARHSGLTGDLEEIQILCASGRLHGWVVPAVGRGSRAAVVVVGGLSGWGGVYLDIGRALAARGVTAILAEGPGQGLTRMRSGMHLDEATLPLFSVFVDHAQGLGAQRIGVWGNSFGGLFAAHLAARDLRVEAVCINGAPMTPEVPPFRTAREQMRAVFGVDDEGALARRLQSLCMDPRRQQIHAHMLVAQGGRDPLVPLGQQASFFALAPKHRQSTFTWPKGEHTIYNYAQERNARVADWFHERLAIPIDSMKSINNLGDSSESKQRG